MQSPLASAPFEIAVDIDKRSFAAGSFQLVQPMPRHRILSHGRTRAEESLTRKRPPSPSSLSPHKPPPTPSPSSSYTSARHMRNVRLVALVSVRLFRAPKRIRKLGNCRFLHNQIVVLSLSLSVRSRYSHSESAVDTCSSPSICPLLVTTFHLHFDLILVGAQQSLRLVCQPILTFSFSLSLSPFSAICLVSKSS
jgi:hypothetical protein